MSTEFFLGFPILGEKFVNLNFFFYMSAGFTYVRKCAFSAQIFKNGIKIQRSRY